MKTKICIKCDVEKPLSEFYAHPRMHDGHLNKCKSCQRADVTRNRGENLERIRAYDRSRGSRMSPGYLQSYRAKHPGRAAAKSALARAVKSGAVQKPCACWHCGSQRMVVGHHADYSMPLAVTWLCQACHKQVHAMTDRIKQERAA